MRRVASRSISSDKQFTDRPFVTSKLRIDKWKISRGEIYRLVIGKEKGKTELVFAIIRNIDAIRARAEIKIYI